MIVMLEQESICSKASFVFKLFGSAINIARWIIPVVIIVMVSIDTYKALANKTADTKELISKASKRFLFAVLIFFIPTIIKIAFRAIPVPDGGFTGIMGAINCLFSYANI